MPEKAYKRGSFGYFRTCCIIRFMEVSPALSSARCTRQPLQHSGTAVSFNCLFSPIYDSPAPLQNRYRACCQPSVPGTINRRGHAYEPVHDLAYATEVLYHLLCASHHTAHLMPFDSIACGDSGPDSCVCVAAPKPKKSGRGEISHPYQWICFLSRLITALDHRYYATF